MLWILEKKVYQTYLVSTQTHVKIGEYENLHNFQPHVENWFN